MKKPQMSELIPKIFAESTTQQQTLFEGDQKIAKKRSPGSFFDDRVVVMAIADKKLSSSEFEYRADGYPHSIPKKNDLYLPLEKLVSLQNICQKPHSTTQMLLTLKEYTTLVISQESSKSPW